MTTCEICQKEYETEAKLKRHQQTAKFCKQGRLIADLEDRVEELEEEVEGLQKDLKLHKHRAKKYKHHFKKMLENRQVEN